MKFLYYLIQWTWGLPTNIIGGIACLVCAIRKCPIQKYRNGVEILVNNNFGGLELGMFFIRGKDCLGVRPHEYGHGIQHLWWGPLFPFVIGLPSAARYWLREQKTQQDKKKWTMSLFCVITLACLIVGGIGVGWCWTLPIIAICAWCYGCILCGWLRWIETPKYETNPPKYDDIWFEGQATALGNAANENKWSWL